MYELLFSVPWYLPLLLAVAGVAVFIWANNRLHKRGRQAGVGLVSLAILWCAVSYLVDTPKEQVVDHTRAFVHAVVKQDKDRLSQLLDDSVIAGNWGKPEIIDGAPFYAKQTGLTNARIIGLNVETEGNLLVTYPTVWSTHSGGKMVIDNLNSSWKLIWGKEGDTWFLREIIPLQIGQTQRNDIEAQYLDRPRR